MTIVMTRADEAPRFHLPGLEFTGLASPSRGSAGLCTWRLTLEPGLTDSNVHTLDCDEIFMVIRGAIRLSRDAELVSAGDVAVVPAGTPIQVANPGDDEAVVVVVIASDFTATMADGRTIDTPPWAL